LSLPFRHRFGRLSVFSKTAVLIDSDPRFGVRFVLTDAKREVTFMRKLWLFCLILIPLAAVSPQTTSPEGFKYWPAASTNQTVQVLTQQASTDLHHFAVQQLGDFTNETVVLVHREADGQAEWHETQVDVVFVQSGSATLVVGGTLVDGETVAPHEKRNGTIEGGFRQKVAAGDMIRIPPKTPHQFLLDGSKELTYVVVKVKGY
jgi:mannose-6-phosphate isomerase-like protein (cupin superfamily)